MTHEVLFKRITNAVLDLQSTNYQSLARPYRVLIQALDAEELRPLTNALTAKVDFEGFMARSERSTGSMIGSARLDWPDDHDEYLGLSLLLLRKFREHPDQLPSFAFQFFNGHNLVQSLRNFVSNFVIPFVRDFKDYVDVRAPVDESSAETRASARAPMNSQINIHTFQGILGDVVDSTVHQNLQMGIAAKDMEGLLAHLRAQHVDDADLAELKAAIEADPQPNSKGSFGSNVSAWIGKMMVLAASGGWSVSLSAAGNLLSTAIAAYYGLPG